MDVLIKEKCSRPLPSGAVQSYPAGWSGSVPDECAREWLAGGKAVPLVPTPGATAQQFSPEQTAVLQAAANQILANHALNASPPGDISEEEQEELTLDALEDDELRELAKNAKLKGWNSMKRETLIARLTELADEQTDGETDGEADGEGE